MNGLENRSQGSAESEGPKAEADAKVGAALSTSGHGAAHESGATLHDDATSHAAADAVGAKAFAAGNDVFFGAGHNDSGNAQSPVTNHELTHVQQANSAGVAGPEPGNFTVAATHDSAEVGARDGSGSGDAHANTIYRDPTPGGTPATTGTGPAAGPTPTPGGTPPTVDAISGGATAEQQYNEWKTTITSFNRPQAISKWAALPPEGKAKFKSEPGDFQTSVIFVMKKDSVKVFKDGGVAITDNNNSYSIFLKDDFAEWLPELRSALFLTPFLNAEPRTTHVTQVEARKLKTWVDATTDIAEAKAIFHKVYPQLHDTSYASTGTAQPWPLDRIQQLFGVLSQYLSAGHASTVTGGFVYVTGAGFGWWNSSAKRVWLPDSGNGAGHDMTGGTGRGINRTDDPTGNYGSTSTTGRTGRSVAPDPGQPAGIGHMVGTILHEVGHGVGQQLDGGRGNAYAEDANNFPGFNKIGINDIANDLWVNGATGAGAEPVVHKNAKLDDEHAKDFFKTELGGGSYSPGWTGNPPRADMANYCKWKYANVPLMKFWDYFVERSHPKADAYRWDEEAARVPAGSSWVYGYLSRGAMGWTKYKKQAWDQKVSWYSISSPREWFAEQYTHFYRTEKSGSGIDPTTLGLLKDLDKKEFVPTTGGDGVTIGNGGTPGGSSSGSTGPGSAATAPASGATAPGRSEEDRPLMFPWN